MTPDHTRSDRKRLLSGNVQTVRGHRLVELSERLPGPEPTAYTDTRSGGLAYGTQYWRCVHCGHERNHHDAYDDRCATGATLGVRADGGYSVDDDRTRTALSEDIVVRYRGPSAVYDVREESGFTHRVDMDAVTCTCPDSVGGQPYCKHVRRVDIERRVGTVPRNGPSTVESSHGR